MQGKDVREEPKGIVFISRLLLLFRFCHLCFFPNPEVSMRQSGTMLTIEAKSCNCEEVFQWKSQPFILSKLPAGNLSMSLSVLSAGSSIKKVLLVLKHMGYWPFTNLPSITIRDISSYLPLFHFGANIRKGYWSPSRGRKSCSHGMAATIVWDILLNLAHTLFSAALSFPLHIRDTVHLHLEILFLWYDKHNTARDNV